jgi:hypothetical protein
LTRLGGISGRKGGWRPERAAGKPEGSHVTLKKPGFPILVIPLHPEVSAFLQRSQVKRAGLTEEEFRKLL